MAMSLWGAAFTIPDTPKEAKKVVDKIKNPKDTKVSTSKVMKSDKVSVVDKLRLIRENVKRILGKYSDSTQLIRTKEELHSYIDKAIENNLIAIDTETDNSLDPITCKLMGPCIYTPGLKNVYIPINHVDITTRELLPDQLTEKDVKEEFDRLKTAINDGPVRIITHNGKFDYEVLKMTSDFEMPVYWDTMVAEKLLDENQKEYKLKVQYREKIDPDQEKYDIEGLFEGIEYAVVEPELFALYAATDAYMTYMLYMNQVERFSRPGHERLLKLFHEIEMPILPISAEMELEGVELDIPYSERLKAKYNDKLKVMDEQTAAEVKKYDSVIQEWRVTKEAMETTVKNGKLQRSKSEQLKTPINLDSPVQLAILLYDVLKVGVVNKKKPRGTGEEELEAIYAKYKLNICKVILERRGLLKLVNTYVDKLPNCVNSFDNKIHAKFDQLGAGTGRFSSRDPNLQNIPSHEKSIRLLFKASTVYKDICVDSESKIQVSDFYDLHTSDGWLCIKKIQVGSQVETTNGYSKILSIDKSDAHKYTIVLSNSDVLLKTRVRYILTGSDYSAQEPRMLTCFSSDSRMLDAYMHNKDLYAIIAQQAFHNNYWDNMEHNEDGTPNPEGKKRRGIAKTLLLGIMYGRGAASIAEQIECSVPEAQKIIDNFFKSFPQVGEWINKTNTDAKKNGFVEDYWGRRRRLPDIMKPKYSITVIGEDASLSANFNPILGTKGLVTGGGGTKQERWAEILSKCKGRKEYETIKENARKEDVLIVDNGAFIAQAERQCVNSRIQGSAATLTKLAMIEVYNDPVLRDLGFKLLIGVHDELIGSCPEENAEEVSKRLPEMMVYAAKKGGVDVPMKCDPEIEKNWYSNVLAAEINKEYKVLIEGDSKKAIDPVPPEEALEKLKRDYAFLDAVNIDDVITNGDGIVIREAQC